MVAGTLAGCPGSHTSDGPTHSADDLSRQMAEAFCAQAVRCERGGDPSRTVVLLADIDRCAAILSRRLRCHGAIRAVAEGAAGLNGRAWEACVDAMAASCSMAMAGGLAVSHPDCLAAFEGRVAEGESCRWSAECAGVATCEVPHDATTGTCAPPADLGSACSSDEECGKDRECVDLLDDPRCAEASTGPDAAPGEPCGQISLSRTSIVWRGCEPGSRCTARPGEEGLCEAVVADGGPCVSDDECSDRSLCDGDRCRAVELVRTAGAPCDGVLRLCDELARLWCEDGACREVGDGSLGSRCSTVDRGLYTCDDGLTCREERCVEPTTVPPLCSG